MLKRMVLIVCLIGLLAVPSLATSSIDVSWRGVMGRTASLYFKYNNNQDTYSIRASIGQMTLRFDPSSAVGAAAEALLSTADANNEVAGWCTDIAQYSQRSWYTYELAGPADAPIGKLPNTNYWLPLMGPDKADHMGRLFAAHLGDVTNAATAAAFQLSVWEIANEASNQYDVRNGQFYTTTTSGWTNTANTWLQDVYSGDIASVTALTNPNYQDYLLQSPAAVVPEPLTLLGVGLCCGATGWYLKRRRSID